ncbi:NIL domain-containing protein [Gloeothece verrucosa]|uniref:NIL domain protein n=1 Tax=Gloeothece verrucosa (strain PCC 7822) TaxID=497965 RepID=E0U8G3_GLOV7|nr:NIL domain-containing protein [Gloeothece verrucosa]ADN12599.1 NIL domain protein [Gloeothece verrucosa PCC 7822]
MTTPQPLHLDQSEFDRPTETRLKIKIPQKYQQQPIISRLTSHHGLEVNIVAALLGANSQNDGWFDLEIRGSSQQIDNALLDLAELDVEVWYQSGQEIDGW